MKHGKGEKAMSEEEVLEALETIKSTLLGTAHRFFSCYADCEDAVQECFYKAWRGRESIQNPEYFKTWATRILVNECKTMLRKKVPIPMEADDSSVYYESEYENIIEFDPLHKAMERIREDDRQLIQMHFIQEYSYREISRIKKRSVGAVIKRVNRSLEVVKRAM